MAVHYEFTNDKYDKISTVMEPLLTSSFPSSSSSNSDPSTDLREYENSRN